MAGWLTVAVGVLHLGVAGVQYATLSFDALFLAGGIGAMLPAGGAPEP